MVPRPTLILDDGEGIANWLGFLDAADQTDLRICVWDHLGFGHSDYAYLDQLRDSGPFYNVGNLYQQSNYQFTSLVNCWVFFVYDLLTVSIAYICLHMLSGLKDNWWNLI